MAQWLDEHGISALPRIGMGVSMGGAVTLRAAAEGTGAQKDRPARSRSESNRLIGPRGMGTLWRAAVDFFTHGVVRGPPL